MSNGTKLVNVNGIIYLVALLFLFFSFALLFPWNYREKKVPLEFKHSSFKPLSMLTINVKDRKLCGLISNALCKNATFSEWRRMPLLYCYITVPILLLLLRVWFVLQSNIRGAKKHEVIPIMACQRNVYLQNEAGQGGKNSRAGGKKLNSNIKMWFHACAPCFFLLFFFRVTKRFICSSVFVPVGEALIILNRGKEHNSEQIPFCSGCVQWEWLKMKSQRV